MTVLPWWLRLNLFFAAPGATGRRPSRLTLFFPLLVAAAAITGCDNDNNNNDNADTDSYPGVTSPGVIAAPRGTHGFPFMSTALDLSSFGYVEEEFLMTGTAQAFIETEEMAPDGRWAVEPNSGVTADYSTRAMVRRPADAADFNGTVVVEWLNVTGGADGTPGWTHTHVELLRSGYIWVGVTTQYVGAQGLIDWETGQQDRYATIEHPGDSFSYDIFSQVAKGVVAPGRKDVRALGDLTTAVERVIAFGQSQSAFRVMTYYNGIQPLSDLFDGFLLQSFGPGAALSESGAAVNTDQSVIPAPDGVPATPDIPVPADALVRTDLESPVLGVNSETDVQLLQAAFSVHQQPDSDTFRMWEFTGTSHADQYLLAITAEDAAKSAYPFDIVCEAPRANSGPLNFGMHAAIDALDNWLGDDTPPPVGERLLVTLVAGTRFISLQRDPATGNALAGIRLPTIAVPVATQTGTRPPGALSSNLFCILFGASDPWNGEVDSWDGQAGFDPSPTPEPLLSILYADEADYVQKITAATDQLIEQGFVLPADRAEIIAEAARVAFP